MGTTGYRQRIVRMPRRLACRWVLAGFCSPLILPAHSFAADVDVSANLEAAPTPADQAGTTDAALPGIMRLGLANLRRPGTWAASVATGYGITESQPAATGSHHRVVGSVALSYTPIAGFDLGLRLDGRRDGHAPDVQGSDISYNGEPALTARYGHAVGNGTWSADLTARVPGREAPSLAFDAAVVDAKGGYAYRSGGLTVATIAGFRLDRSGQAKPNLALTRAGDRVALGLSDYNAALVGVGLMYQLRNTDLLGELSADLLLGAPSVAQSPMRAGLGVRHHVGDNWQVFALIETSPSARPDLGATDGLVPIEPRFSGRLGLGYTFGKRSVAMDAPADFAKPNPAEEPKKTLETKPVVAADPEPAPVEPAGQLRGLIRSFNGVGLRATVRVEPIGVESHTDEEGAFAIDVPPGTYQVQIVTKGFKPQSREVRIEENGVTVLNADLRRERGSK